MSGYTYRVEMRFGQDHRQVDADHFEEKGDWLVFFRKPPQGGMREYWRARLDAVVSIETAKRSGA